MFINKRIQWGLFALALAMSLSSLYFEFVVGLLPCPLCVVQRLAIFCMTIFLLFKLLSTNKKLYCSFSILSALMATLGIFFAGRQVYLQSLPADKAPACGPSIDMLIKYFPLQDIVKALFYGTGDCAKVEWTFLGGSIAFWSLLAFIFFAYCFLGEFWMRHRAQINSHK